MEDMKDMKGKIYKLICPINNEVRYIGKTTQTLKRRLYNHIYRSKNYLKEKRYASHKINWINKLIKMELIDFLIIEEIEEVSLSMIDEREKYWINYYNHLFDLTNSTDGGRYCKVTSIDTLKKISMSKMGNTYMLGKKHSEKTKKLLSKKLSGKNSPNYGKCHSDETKEKIGNSNRGVKNGMYGRKYKMNESTKRKISSSQKGRVQTKETKEKISNKMSIPIYVLNEEMDIILKFRNSTKCSEYFNCTRGNIKNAIRDKRKIKYKYWVVREENYEKFIEEN